MSFASKVFPCRVRLAWLGCSALLQCAAPHLLQAADSPPSARAHSVRAGSHGRGFIPDPAGYRNTQAVQAFRDYLPVRYDLAVDLPPPGNQGRQGSCVAWSVGYAARTYYLKHYYSADVTQRENILSPAYIYNSLKQSGGDCDDGLSLTGALQLLEKSGGVPLSVLPYDPHQCLTLPSAQELSQYSDRFRIRGYRKVKDEDDVKGELYRDNPVIFAIDAGPVFDHYRSGIIDGTEDPGPGSAHAMVIVGYDDDKQAFHFVNSWGTAWGEKGFGWISYRAARALWIEGYVMDVAPPAAPPAPPPAPAPAPSFVDAPQLDPSAPCSHVTATAVRSGAGFAVKLSGFVGRQEDLTAIRNATLKQAAVISIDSSEVALHPWPQCEALLTLGAALANGHGMALSKTPDKAHVVRGEELTFVVRSPDYPSYLYVAYVQADGSAKFLVRPTGSGLVPPNSVITLGVGSHTVHYKVGPPYGSEMVVALASDAPLLGEDLPIHDRQLLTAYRRVLAHAQTASAALVTLDTAEE